MKVNHGLFLVNCIPVRNVLYERLNTIDTNETSATCTIQIIKIKLNDEKLQRLNAYVQCKGAYRRCNCISFSKCKNHFSF